MELILKETVDNLGEEGDLVKVKAGYGRNYLLPRKLAVIANKSTLAILKQEQKSIAAKKALQKSEGEALAKRIGQTTVVIAQRVGAEDKLYGSVTNSDIAAKLAETGISLDKRKILLEEPIKTLGESKVKVRIGYQLIAELTVQIVPLDLN